jgi:hypothetical protein
VDETYRYEHGERRIATKQCGDIMGCFILGAADDKVGSCGCGRFQRADDVFRDPPFLDDASSNGGVLVRVDSNAPDVTNLFG